MTGSWLKKKGGKKLADDLTIATETTAMGKTKEMGSENNGQESSVKKRVGKSPRWIIRSKCISSRVTKRKPIAAAEDDSDYDASVSEDSSENESSYEESEVEDEEQIKKKIRKMENLIKEQQKKLKVVKAKERKWVDSVVAEIGQKSEADDGVNASPTMVTVNESKNKTTKKN